VKTTVDSHKITADMVPRCGAAACGRSDSKLIIQRLFTQQFVWCYQQFVWCSQQFVCAQQIVWHAQVFYMVSTVVFHGLLAICVVFLAVLCGIHNVFCALLSGTCDVFSSFMRYPQWFYALTVVLSGFLRGFMWFPQKFCGLLTVFMWYAQRLFVACAVVLCGMHRGYLWLAQWFV
jgi:hypothetical protein